MSTAPGTTDSGFSRVFELAGQLWRALRRKDACGDEAQGNPLRPGKTCLFTHDDQGRPRLEGPILRVNFPRPLAEPPKELPP